jgi:tetratricopeptide (TPR) repeat protein
MPESARILPFRGRAASTLSQLEFRQIAERYLQTPPTDRSEEFACECFSKPEVLLAVCSRLRDLTDISPATVADEAERLYCWLLKSGRSVGVFDEPDYLLGETASLAGAACRFLGKRGEAELWFERAEAGFRHTVNPAPLLAGLAYSRLTLNYDRRLYDRIFELLPSLIASFEKLGMRRDVLKCRFLEGMSLKEVGRLDQAADAFGRLRADPYLAREPRLMALVLVNFGELLSGRGKYADAVSLFREALSLQKECHQPLAVAHLKGVTGEALRQQGLLPQALEAYRAAIEEYEEAGMGTLAAYLRLVAAETLIAMSRHREAEWEIMAALPTIDEQKMVPEGFAAVALLRESVRRRKTDPNALRELREHLQAKK